jgi:hypothetical protein
MFIPTLDGSIENVIIETPNPLIERKYVLTSQMEGAQFSALLGNNTKGPYRSTNNDTQTF